MLAKKLIFSHSRKYFYICRVSTFKVYAEGKSFTDYSLTIVAEIYIIFRSELTRQMNNRPYSLGTDGSNDESVIKKLNRASIRLFHDKKGIVSAHLLNLGGWKEGNTDTLFNNIDSILRENIIDWKNCVAVGLGDTTVHIGENSSIMTHVLTKNKNMFTNDCPCHIIHNTGNKAKERFSEVSDFDVEDFLVDLFHWFDESSKRKSTSNFQP